jgi:hypothetical protein
MITWYKEWKEKRRLKAEARRNPLAELARMGAELEAKAAQVEAQFHSFNANLEVSKHKLNPATYAHAKGAILQNREDKLRSISSTQDRLAVAKSLAELNQHMDSGLHFLAQMGKPALPAPIEVFDPFEL